MRVLERWGGWLIRPRAQAPRVGPDEARWDAIGLGLLYAIGTSLYAIVEAFATVLAVHDVIVFATAIGRVLLAPLIVIVGVEWVLGSARAYQRAAGLLPLVIVATAAHAARQLGWAVPGGPLVPDIVGGALGLALVWWIRDSIRPLEEGER